MRRDPQLILIAFWLLLCALLLGGLFIWLVIDHGGFALNSMQPRDKILHALFGYALGWISLPAAIGVSLGVEVFDGVTELGTCDIIDAGAGAAGGVIGMIHRDAEKEELK
jgi:hypothetical protein